MKPGFQHGWLPDRPSTPAEALAWDATRYLLDELGPAEAAAFEQQLDRDQAAREALAAAAELTGALALVAAEQAPAPVLHLPAQRWSGAAWVRRGLVASAAAALVAAGAWTLRPLPPASRVRPEAWWIAATWANLHRGEAIGSPEVDTTAAGDLLLDADSEVADVPAERPVPSWMVAAASVIGSETETSDMSEMGDMDDGKSLMDEGD